MVTVSDVFITMQKIRHLEAKGPKNLFSLSSWTTTIWIAELVQTTTWNLGTLSILGDSHQKCGQSDCSWPSFTAQVLFACPYNFQAFKLSRLGYTSGWHLLEVCASLSPLSRVTVT